jgi:hypothetical protein
MEAINKHKMIELKETLFKHKIYTISLFLKKLS